ncbi:MAG: hypothetical protein H6577_19130 [Lewinellaceae bacterium]|nr:hypothetical protein [Saprospiraceae bacterium]MCB9340239.1 hypothetical protein [Lewinellaceae bacterium]
MNRRRFFLQLIMLTGSALVVLILFQFSPVFKADRLLSFFSLAFFAGITVVMYLMAVKAAVSKDKNAFTRLIMVFTFVKLFLSITIIIAYTKVAQPTGKYFILPFFLVYLVFTIFETLFMTKLGKIKAR